MTLQEVEKRLQGILTEPSGPETGLVLVWAKYVNLEGSTFLILNRTYRQFHAPLSIVYARGRNLEQLIRNYDKHNEPGWSDAPVDEEDEQGEEPVEVSLGGPEFRPADPVETARDASLKILEHDNAELRTKLDHYTEENKYLNTALEGANKEVDRLKGLNDALMADAKAREGMIQKLYEPGDVVKLLPGDREAVVLEARICSGKLVKYMVSYWSGNQGTGVRRTALVAAREVSDGDVLKPRVEPLVKDTAGMGTDQPYEAQP